MRLTLNKLKELCNEYLENVEASTRITEIYKTHYRSHDYEGGAAHFNLKMQENGSDNYCWVHIFYPLKYIEYELNKGNNLIFKPKYKDVFMDGEFDLSR